MTSREIAELTGKRHDNVLADIRSMLDALELTHLSFQASYKDSTGRTLACFALPQALTITLVSGYSVPMRHRIVTRWRELRPHQGSDSAHSGPRLYRPPRRTTALEPTALATVTPLSRSLSRIRRGQRSWGQIKATAEEQRALWMDVAVALKEGKVESNRPVTGKDSSGRPKHQKFSEWVQEMFPGLRPHTVADALWLCANLALIAEIPQGLTHPESIRKWHSNRDGAIDLDAERAAKTILRAQAGGEGSDIAQRYLRNHFDGPEYLTKICPGVFDRAQRRLPPVPPPRATARTPGWVLVGPSMLPGLAL